MAFQRDSFQPDAFQPGVTESESAFQLDAFQMDAFQLLFVQASAPTTNEGHARRSPVRRVVLQ